ncbi:MAG: hypothetical protein K2Q20_01550 [Phycisphaerales bacterium]|nr:hypothetical protein [Phycisphaerales bacterium]
MRSPTCVLAFTVGLIASGAVAQTASFGPTGLSENFNSIGTAGTIPPNGWTIWTGNSGTSNSTWTTTIPANGANSVASMIATTGPLTAITTPTVNNNNAFNAALSSSNTADRVLATSPTTVSGGAIQAAINNASGSDFPAGFIFNISFDTVRYNIALNSSNVATNNELPGYWLFWSLDNGTTWTNISSLNPTITTVPNTVGVTSVTNASISFSADWTAGSTLRLRWVDDNAAQTSPDQIIGLNNVSLVPAPGAGALMGAGLLLSVRRRR